MYIKHLEVENWKCFANKRSFNFKRHELIKMRNGTGKTSIFEAILYAIWGKAPVGFNLNTVRNDDSKPCRIFISFDLTVDGVQKNATIERIFGNSVPFCELRIDGTLVCESVRTIESYMDGIINQKITEQLWTSSLIESNITSSNFFNKAILEDILKDPLALMNTYKSKIYSANRKINSFNQTILNLEEIESKLESIKSKLKEKSNGDINLAKSSAAAHDKIKTLESIIGGCNLSLEDARMYLRLLPNKSKIELSLEQELKKKESVFSKFNKRVVEAIMNESKQVNHCIICNGEFDESHIARLKEELMLTGRSEEKIEDLRNQLNLLSNDQKVMEAIVEIESQRSILNKCPNYKEIIESYNAENDALWNEFENVQKQYALALKQQEELKEINELKVKVTDYKEKLNVLNEYTQNAGAYYTNKIMEKATQYLSSINSRYKQICLFEGSFHVVVEDANFALNMLPIVRLSSGEKTICALSLLFAVHNVIVPELPLLFDETFSALDVENLEQIQRFLRKQSAQIFIITHDKNWNEF